MRHDTINKAAIDELMEIFYEQIRHHKELGAIFNAKISTSDEKWAIHKAKISNFWQGMLLGEGDYSGQPMKAHLELPSFPQKLFDEWLKLFEMSLWSIAVKYVDKFIPCGIRVRVGIQVLLKSLAETRCTHLFLKLAHHYWRLLIYDVAI